MILADTTIWIDHLRSEIREMSEHLLKTSIVIHPFVIGELALGSLRDRARTLAWLDMLPIVRVARMSELRQMIEARSLYCRGIGLTEAHLIASCLIQPPTLLWTRDKKLRATVEALGINANLP
jgi:hypothetical protein